MDSQQKQLDKVIEYYDHTRYDYRVAWDNSPHPAVHFGFYDEQADKHAAALQNTNRVLADLAKIKAGDRVLDAGCGKGGSSFWLATHRKAIPTGITPVQTQIDDCLRQAKHLGLDKEVSFVNADYCNTPFTDGSFDVIWACESVCHALDKAAFYKEAYRLLAPGGRLVMAEYFRNKRPLLADDEVLLGNWLHNWAIPDIDTAHEHQHNAQNAGFEQFKILDFTDKTKVSLRNLYKKSKLFKNISKLYQLFWRRTKVQHQNLIGSIRQYEALEKELWFYGVITAVKS